MEAAQPTVASAIDTARILVGWDCNLICSYCCNQQPRIRSGILPVRLDEIDFAKYAVLCITGGEPLLHMDRIEAICARAAPDQLIVLYTNGMLFTREVAEQLKGFGVAAMNVGLHVPETFDYVIKLVCAANPDRALKVRFCANSFYWHALTRDHPHLNFRFWRMDDCDRPNEDRFVLIP